MLFKSRIQQLLIMFVIGWLLVVGRLFHLQVVNADYYGDQASGKLLRESRPLEALRGRIVDRHGAQLAADSPAWSIALHYRLLDSKCPADNPYIKELSKVFLPQFADLDPQAAHHAALMKTRDELRQLWLDIAAFGERELEVIEETARRHVDTIAAWKDDYFLRNHIYVEMREERQCHPLVSGLSPKQRVDVQMWLKEHYGWLIAAGGIELTNSQVRDYARHPSVAHLLGTMGEASRADIDARPYRIDGPHADHGGYRLGDHRGVSGVEWSHEDVLRGTRGRVQRYRDGRADERQPPVNGTDVALSIDFALQRAVYDVLAAKVDDPNDDHDIPGGSVVVLDVDTREILAMVSYPAYDITTYRRDYDQLILDTVGQPTIHRAVRASYPPGSIVKPITVTAGRDSGVLGAHTTLECQGRLIPTSRYYKCWRPTGQQEPKRHGSITGEEAIMHSCNVFCYKTADHMTAKLGAEGTVEHMCAWMERFGVGQPSGIQLREDLGHLPTPAWLQKYRRDKPTAGKGDPRNYAIGQGEVEVTPLQAANIVATFASGVYRPVTLMRDEIHEHGTPVVTKDTWEIIRRGMYRVVNDNSGTAKGSKPKSAGFVLCGKSGSAQAVPLTTRMTVGCDVDHPTHFGIYQTNNLYDARNLFLAEFPDHNAEDVIVLERERWPAPPGNGRTLSHAWFVGFIQPAPDGAPDWSVTAPVAIAVLLEFGDSGGRVAGPVCAEVADVVIKEFPAYVEGRR